MSKLVTGLMFSTLAFAASTFYLSYQLGVEREKNLRPTAPTPPAQRTTGDATGPDAAEPATATDIPGAEAASDDSDRHDPAQTAVTRDRLEQLRNPVTRAEQAQQLAALFRADWRSIAPRIGMSPADMERMLADLTERTQVQMERRFECELDPACDAEALKSAPGMSLDDRIAAALGPERYPRYKRFQETSAENSTVHWLNEQLGAANALSDATADRLVQVLDEHRRQFVREAEARGEKVEAEAGEVAIRSAAIAGAADQYARRRESATAYFRRMVELASGVLSHEQLAAFREMGERNLYGYTERMRRAEISDSARNSAGR
jgi:hypothetical protein